MKIGRFVAVLFILPLLAGCPAPLQPAPFEEFRISATEFQSGSDAVLEEVATLAEEGFATPSALDKDVTFSSIVLVWSPVDPTQSSQTIDPLHVQLRQLRRGVYSLNSGLLDYAESLSLLAGGAATDAKKVEDLTRSANTNLRTARDAIGADVSDDQLAIFTTITAEVFQRKIERDRQKFLSETMTSAQPILEAFSQHLVATMNLVAGDITSVYLGWARVQQGLYDTTTGPSQRQILIDLQNRNDRTQQLLEVIRTLRNGYKTLPAAHKELLQGASNAENFVASIRRLYVDAKRLQALRKELAETTATNSEEE